MRVDVNPIFSYSLALLGGFLAMFVHIYWLGGRGDWFNPQRLSDAIGQGLIFGHLIALMATAILSIRLNRTALRLVAQVMVGTLLGTISWGAHLYLFLYQTSPDIVVLAFGGFLLALGFVVSANSGQVPQVWRFIFDVIITSLLIFLPIYITYQGYLMDISSQALLYFQADNPNDSLLIGISFAVTIATFGNLASSFIGD